jgi:uncharacterized membrane protein
MSGLWKSKCEDCKYWTDNLCIIGPLMLIGIAYIIAVFFLTGIKLNLNSFHLFGYYLISFEETSAFQSG